MTATFTVTPGGSFNFFGFTLVTGKIDASAEVPSTAGTLVKSFKLPNSFTPVSVLPLLDPTATAVVSGSQTAGWTVTVTFTRSSTEGAAVPTGKAEVLVLGRP